MERETFDGVEVLYHEGFHRGLFFCAPHRDTGDPVTVSMTFWDMVKPILVGPREMPEKVELLADLSSPIKAFLREECEVKPGAEAPCDDVYRAWVRFCVRSGRDHPGTVQSFGRDLRAASPVLGVQQRRLSGRGRVRCFVGLKLRPTAQEGA